jgi:hypothetical protein
MERNRQRALQLVLRKLANLTAYPYGGDGDVAGANPKHLVDDLDSANHVREVQAGLCMHSSICSASGHWGGRPLCNCHTRHERCQTHVAWTMTADIVASMHASPLGIHACLARKHVATDC